MKIVLFDMDGTLTPARQEMEWDIVDSLYNLQSNGFEIGIVSGSDLDYIRQQCNILFDLSQVDCGAIHWLPCNGTKYYRYGKANIGSVDFEKIYEKKQKMQYTLRWRDGKSRRRRWDFAAISARSEAARQRCSCFCRPTPARKPGLFEKSGRIAFTARSVLWALDGKP